MSSTKNKTAEPSAETREAMQELHTLLNPVFWSDKHMYKKARGAFMRLDASLGLVREADDPEPVRGSAPKRVEF